LGEDALISLSDLDEFVAVLERSRAEGGRARWGMILGRISSDAHIRLGILK
jgi:hypothetical protein